jgi:hypothetical protein
VGSKANWYDLKIVFNGEKTKIYSPSDTFLRYQGKLN